MMDAPPLRTRLLAEVIGTFGFFFIGFSGIAASVNLPGSIAPAGIAAGFGLGLGLMIAAFGQISGGHFNPAVSLGLAVAAAVPDARGRSLLDRAAGRRLRRRRSSPILLYTSDVKDALVTAPGAGSPTGGRC